MVKKMREPVSGLTHLAGAAVSLIGAAALFLQSAGTRHETLALLVYGASLFLLMAASSTYHLVKASPRVVAALRKADHAAIYLLIAGTYTPFCVLAFDGFWRWGFLALIWSLAVIGIAVKMFVMDAPRWVTAGVYVIMGWLSVFAVQEMLAALSPGIIGWLIAGGLIYTAGAVIYITRRMDFAPGVFGFHEVWHIFVLLGAAAHYAAVLRLVTAG